MRFDRPPGDVFAVQDEIAMQVARALEQASMQRERPPDRAGHG